MKFLPPAIDLPRADIGATGHFADYRARRPTLLRVGKFRGSAHVLPALLRPAAAFGGAGAD